MSKKKEDAGTESAEKDTALAVQGSSDILALSDESDMQQIVQENFGTTGLTLADLDKIKIPSAGGVHWAIPSVLEDDEVTTKELAGVIIAWADKKSWWAKAYGETGGGEQPDCKSNDMQHGIGNPMAFINDKEQALIDTGKTGLPVRDTGGWLCATCPHNIFGSAPQGSGKACQDKRFIVMLLQDSVIPVLIRVPATSIMPVKQYFKRLAGAKKSYLSVVTGLSLVKIKGAQDYSQIAPKALRYLTPEETEKVRSLRTPFQEALDAPDAVEQGYTEKGGETLSDMPGKTDAELSAMTGVGDAKLAAEQQASDGAAQKPF